MLTLTDIISRGQAAFEATLPDYLKRIEDEPSRRVNIALTDERQREICLSCPLADCVGLESPNCPIRIEQRAEWRRQNHSKMS